MTLHPNPGWAQHAQDWIDNVRAHAINDLQKRLAQVGAGGAISYDEAADLVDQASQQAVQPWRRNIWYYFINQGRLLRWLVVKGRQLRRGTARNNNAEAMSGLWADRDDLLRSYLIYRACDDIHPRDMAYILDVSIEEVRELTRQAAAL